jgi:putative ABC transport system permease protein
MAMSVFERMSEIGTLRALGWKKQRVMSVILYEALFLSLAGSALGTLVAFTLTHFLSGLPVTSGVIRGGIAPAVIVEGVMIAMLVGVGGGVYPAYWAARLRPVEAMRHK